MLFDSNILIYALNSASPKCKAAQRFINLHLSDGVIAQQNIFETIRVLTHPKFPHPFKARQAIRAVKSISTQLLVIDPTYQTTQLTYELIKKYGVTGSQVFDAYLVATAVNNGVTKIATDNIKHLRKYQEIQIVNPFAKS